MLNEVISRLDGLGQRGMNFGLEREKNLLSALGNPDKKLKIIHIAGTNGKGSCAEYMTNILICAGKRVGTFTSPAVFDFRESFRINGEFADEKLLTKALLQALEYGAEATRFEVETAGALKLFESAGAEYAVVECGLGGAYDATNAISGKEIALITTIGLEHTDVLGGDIKSICAHKAGIIGNCPAVISGLQSEEVKEFFKDYPFAGRYKSPMAGSAQEYDAGLAVEAARLLKIDENAIYSGVNRTNLCGRVQKIRKGDRLYILDGAHNPQSFLPLTENLLGDLEIIYGCLSDKDIDGCLKLLSPFTDTVTAVECDSPRAMSLEKIISCCKRYFKNVKSDSLSGALENAQKNTVVVCGSFTLLKEAREWIEKRQ